MSLLCDKDKNELSTCTSRDLREATHYNHIDGSGNSVCLPIPPAIKQVFERAAAIMESLSNQRDDWRTASDNWKKTAEDLGVQLAKAQEQGGNWREGAQTLQQKMMESEATLASLTEDRRQLMNNLQQAVQEIGVLTSQRDDMLKAYRDAMGFVKKIAKRAQYHLPWRN